MTHFTQNSKDDRVNISLTGDSAKLLRELHSILKIQQMPVKVAVTDVVAIALRLLKHDLSK